MQTSPDYSSRFRTLSGRLAAILCLGLVLAGCGLNTYEQRLHETAEFYEYLNQFQQKLSPTVDIMQKRNAGISIKVPQPFRAAADNVQQPIDETLPGMERQWTALLGNAGIPNAFLYVVSNDALMELHGVGAESESFLTDVEATLERAFGVTVPPEESRDAKPNVRVRHLVPPRGSPSEKYATPKDYGKIQFVPEIPQPGRGAEALLYTRTVDNVQVGVVLITTEPVSADLRQRMDLALQTLEVIPLKPSGPAGRGGNQSPGGGTTGF